MSTITHLDQGSAPNDGSGTPARTGAGIINDNFDNLNADKMESVVAGNNISIDATDPINLEINLVDSPTVSGTLNITGSLSFDASGSINPSAGFIDIDLPAGVHFRIRSSGLTPRFRVEEDTGDVYILGGNLGVAAGDINSTSGDLNLNFGDVNVVNGNINVQDGWIDVGNLRINQADDSIHLANASVFSIKDAGGINTRLTVDENTGDTDIVTGDLTVTAGNFAVTAGTSDFGGDITIGNLTIDESADAIVLAGASTLSIQDSGASDIITFDEATGDVGIVKGELTLTDTLRISAIAPSINFNGAIGNIISDSTLVISTSSNDLTLSANGGNNTINLNCATANFNSSLLDSVDGIEYRSGAANPTTTDIPAGYTANWYNTTLGEMRTWANISNTMYFSAAFTT